MKNHIKYNYFYHLDVKQVSEHINNCKKCSKTEKSIKRVEQLYRQCFEEFCITSEIKNIMSFSTMELCVLGALCGYSEFPGITLKVNGNEKEYVQKAVKSLERSRALSIGIDASAVIDTEIYDCINTICGYKDIMFLKIDSHKFGHIIFKIYHSNNKCCLITDMPGKQHAILLIEDKPRVSIKDCTDKIEINTKVFKKLKRKICGFDESTADKLFEETELDGKQQKLIKRMILKENNLGIVKHYEKAKNEIRLVSDGAFICDNNTLTQLILINN